MELPSPPITPLQRRHKRSSTSAGSISLERVTEESVTDAASEARRLGDSTGNSTIVGKKVWEETIPRPYAKHYRRCEPCWSDDGEYGRGVWSVVYRCVETSCTQGSAPITPPSSPTGSTSLRQNAKIVAVKAPARRDANRILYHEARTLTFLHSFPEAQDYLVPFHGFEQATYSIILSAIPLSLEEHVKIAAKKAHDNSSTRTMFDPIIGSREWQFLASALISGLTFLHDHKCIHGDIKPANILLQQSEDGNAYTPLYCDFSSSFIETDSHAASDITALTTEYLSPELITSLITSKASVFPKTAPDIFALAVALLFAALGESPYACARTDTMKLCMIREGRPMQFATSGEQAARVRKGSLVEKALTGALAHDFAARWTACE